MAKPNGGAGEAGGVGKGENLASYSSLATAMLRFAPPRETSPVAKSEEKRMFSQATAMRSSNCRKKKKTKAVPVCEQL